MISLSSYHSNGLPTVIWSNKVNLIGEKVYKPKIHFCEHCNKPILIYGRLIPCKHVFCFTCATLCLSTNQSSLSYCSTLNNNPGSIPGPSEPPPISNNSPQLNSQSPQTNNIGGHTEKFGRRNRRNSRNRKASRNDFFTNRNRIGPNPMEIDESDPTNAIQPDISTVSNLPKAGPHDSNGTIQPQNHSLPSQCCHRCGGRALRVERNTLNSIFVCQVDSCKRTYLSARDLQAHVTHRHNRTKSGTGYGTTSSASLQAISSSPYISSSTLMHLNNHVSGSNNRQSSSFASPSSCSNAINSNNNNCNTNNSKTHNNHDNHHSPNISHHNFNNQRRPNRDPQHFDGTPRDRDRDRDRERERERERYNRERERERDSKEYHRQSLQRAAQWAEASAQMLEKGLTR